MNDRKGSKYQQQIMLMLGSKPVSYNPQFVKILGSVSAALVMSQFLFWQGVKGTDEWFFKTESEIEDETGLTAEQFFTARKKLLAAGVIEQVKKGNPGKNYYRVIFDQLCELCAKFSSVESGNKKPGNTVTSDRETREQETANHGDYIGKRVLTESTPEINAFALASEDTSPSKPRPKTPKTDYADPVIQEIYSLYPQKVNKLAAFKAIRKAWDLVALRRAGDKAGSAAFLKERVRLYAKAMEPSDERGFIPYPATWFNAGKYDDDASNWQPPMKKRAFDDEPDDTGPEPARKSLTPDEYEKQRRLKREAKRNENATQAVAAAGREPEVRSGYPA